MAKGVYLLLLLLASAAACFGQRNVERKPPLDPVQAAEDARALVADMLAQVPERSTTNTGVLRILDPEGNERDIPVRFDITVTPTNWTSAYETLPSAGSAGGLRLNIIHAGEEPTRYELFDPAATGATNGEPRQLTPKEIMAPFAGSDFWIADLGLEFLHWPQQKLKEKNTIRHTKASHVLVSTNPAPVPGGYAKVESWIMIARPHGILHADAYDEHGQVIKRFDPSNVEKIQGEYQLEEMEMRNSKTGSQTRIKFKLAEKGP